NKKGTIFQVRRWKEKGVSNVADETRKDPRDWILGRRSRAPKLPALKILSEQAHKPVPGKHPTKAEASEPIDKLKAKSGLQRQERPPRPAVAMATDMMKEKSQRNIRSSPVSYIR